MQRKRRKNDAEKPVWCIYANHSSFFAGIIQLIKMHISKTISVRLQFAFAKDRVYNNNNNNENEYHKSY